MKEGEGEDIINSLAEMGSIYLFLTWFKKSILELIFSIQDHTTAWQHKIYGQRSILLKRKELLIKGIVSRD